MQSHIWYMNCLHNVIIHACKFTHVPFMRHIKNIKKERGISASLSLAYLLYYLRYSTTL